MTPPRITRRYCNWRAEGDTAEIGAKNWPLAVADRFYTVNLIVTMKDMKIHEGGTPSTRF